METVTVRNAYDYGFQHIAHGHKGQFGHVADDELMAAWFTMPDRKSLVCRVCNLTIVQP